MASLTPSPIMQFFNNQDTFLVGGLLYTYAAGTQTPLATYQDQAGTIANTNPVVLNTRGEAAVWLSNAQYKFVLRDSSGNLIWTADNINGPDAATLATLAASNGATLVGFTPSGGAATTVAAQLQTLISSGASVISYTPADTGIPTNINARLQLLDGTSRTTTNADGYTGASIYVFRDTTGVTGGTAGYVNAASVARTTTGATETAFEWTTLSIMDNYSAAGENVAFYGQGNKRSTGGTWGGVFEARDFTQVANPTGGLVGLEVDVFANGTDTGNERIGIDIVAGKGVSSGTINTVGIGMRIGPVNADITKGQYSSGIFLSGTMVTGLNVASSGTWGALFTGTNAVGIDLPTGTNSTSAIRIKNSENIAFDASSVYKLQHKSSGVAGLVYSVSGTDKTIFSDTGGIVLSETIAWTNSYASSSATAGANGAPPSQVAGYIIVNINGTNVKVPYYNT
jgi:hypothetical protein